MESQTQNRNESYIYICGTFYKVEINLNDCCAIENVVRSTLKKCYGGDFCNVEATYIKTVTTDRWTLHAYYVSAGFISDIVYIVTVTSDRALLSEIEEFISKDIKTIEVKDIENTKKAKSFIYMCGKYYEVDLSPEDLEKCRCRVEKALWNAFIDCYGAELCNPSLTPIWRYETPRGIVMKYKVTTEIGSENAYFIFGDHLTREEAARLLEGK